jgi:hypothetical protein
MKLAVIGPREMYPTVGATLRVWIGYTWLSHCEAAIIGGPATGMDRTL